jgi:NhaP-type Na+/H+ or K+/H+ antiporter
VDWTLAAIAAAILAYAAISGRVEGTPITPAIVFVAIGLLAGPEALGLIDLASHSEPVKRLAEATLTVVLFADASRIDLRVLRREIAIPARLLGIGLPLTIVTGLVVAVALFAGLAWPEALLLAVILAPTDAALGQAVVTLPRLPSRIRQGLNVESGLNDGICVPIFLVVLAVAEAEAGAIGDGAAARLVGEQIGYGAFAGAVAGAVAAAVVVVARRQRDIDAAWLQIGPLAGAALAYGIAAPIGGSGFIAAFVGGMVFGGLLRGRAEDVGYLLEEGGAVLGAVTFVVFGAVLLGPALGHLTLAMVGYALLSLTVIRMLPVAVSLVGSGARSPTVGFLGWFGPRGLASIVFAVMLDEGSNLPGEETILLTVYATVGLSVLLHGLTAAPLANRYATWFETTGPGRLRAEAVEVPDIGPRHAAGARRPR